MFVVYRALLNIVFSLEFLKYIVCLCRRCDMCCVFYLNCEAWSCVCSCMGRVNVPSCRCCILLCLLLCKEECSSSVS